MGKRIFKGKLVRRKGNGNGEGKSKVVRGNGKDERGITNFEKGKVEQKIGERELESK